MASEPPKLAGVDASPATHDAGVILDYASPRRRRRLRLPAQSQVVVFAGEGEDGRQVRLVETLRGRQGALGAIGFAVFTLFVLGVTAYDTMLHALRHRIDAADLGFTFFLVLLWLGELVTLIFVIDQTWRRTILIANPRGLDVRFTGLFGPREHRWSAREVGDVVAAVTQDQDGVVALGEVQVQIVDGPSLRLFTDHRFRDVQRYAAAVHGAMMAAATGTATTTTATDQV